MIAPCLFPVFFQVSYPSQGMSFPGIKCASNFMLNKANLDGINIGCTGDGYVGGSDIPPKTSTASSVNFSDPDLSDTPYGNLSVILTVGNNVNMHGNAGQFFLPKLRYPEYDSKAWYAKNPHRIPIFSLPARPHGLSLALLN